MKRYIITINEFLGLSIKRYDGFFKSPFETRERFEEDDQGWCWCSTTASHMKLLLRRMERLGKADRVDDRTVRFHEIWVVDVIDGLAVGQYMPYGDRPHKMLLPPKQAIEEMDLGKGPEEL